MSQLISPDYLAQNKAMHATNDGYGTSSAQMAPFVRPVADWGRLPILDYGAGREELKRALGPAYRVTGYDPAIEGLDTPPEPHPVVCCTDVLEHIEPDLLDNVLADLRRLTLVRGLWEVHLAPAKRVLPDGRNAHLLQMPADWWVKKAEEAGFTVGTVEAQERGDGIGKDGAVTAVWFWVRPT